MDGAGAWTRAETMWKNRFKRSLGVKLQDMVIGRKRRPARSQGDIQFLGLFAEAINLCEGLE